MEPRRVRLGDVIDDYCPKCRLIMNHGVAGMVGDEVRKVRCNTCMSEHVYRHGTLPKRRRNETDKLFKEVLKGLGRTPDEETGAAREGDEPEVAQTVASEGVAEPASEEPAPPTHPTRDSPGDSASQPPERNAPTPEEAAHGVRRKLYTIRRFSGGKPPNTTGGGSGGSGSGKR